MRIITVADEFAELPVGVVIRDTFGNVYQRVETFGTTHRGWLTVGSEIDVHHKEFELPAAVLWEPGVHEWVPAYAACQSFEYLTDLAAKASNREEA